MISMTCRRVRVTLALLASLTASIEPSTTWAVARIVKVQALGTSSTTHTAVEAITPGVYIEPEALNTELLELLRWYGAANQNPSCPGAGLPKGHTIGTFSIAQLEAKLKEASDQLLHMDLELTQASLRAARDMLECLEAPPSRAALRSLFVMDAVLLATQGNAKADVAFRQLLAVDPRPFLEPEHPPKVRKQYLAVAERELKSPPLEVSLEGLEGELWVNGQQVIGRIDLRPGLHLVQLRSATHLTLSQLVTVPSSSHQPVKMASLLRRSLPIAEEVTHQLEQGLLNERLDPPQKQALLMWLQQQPHAAVAFLLSSKSGKSIVRVIDKSGQLMVLSSALEKLPPGNVQKMPSPRLSLSAQARVGGGVALAQRHQTMTGLTTLEGVIELHPLRLQLGVQGRSDFNGLGIYPTGAGNLLMGVKVPLSSGVSLVPMVGYAAGQGPLLAYDDCGRIDEATIACGEEAGSTQVWTGSFAHGPVFRLEAHKERPSVGKHPQWSVQAGLQATAFLQAAPMPATVTLSTGTASTQYSVRFPALSTDLAMRLEALVGLQRRF